MKRLKAVFFLLVAPLFVAPGIALAWFRFHEGLPITMHPFLELWIWGALLAGISTMVRMAIVLMRGF
jgi:hypothetical protein